MKSILVRFLWVIVALFMSTTVWLQIPLLFETGKMVLGIEGGWLLNVFYIGSWIFVFVIWCIIQAVFTIVAPPVFAMMYSIFKESR